MRPSLVERVLLLRAEEQTDLARLCCDNREPRRATVCPECSRSNRRGYCQRCRLVTSPESAAGSRAAAVGRKRSPCLGGCGVTVFCVGRGYCHRCQEHLGRGFPVPPQDPNGTS